MILRLSAWYGRMLAGLALAGCAVLLLMMLVICVDVLLRNVRLVIEEGVGNQDVHPRGLREQGLQHWFELVRPHLLKRRAIRCDSIFVLRRAHVVRPVDPADALNEFFNSRDGRCGTGHFRRG